MLWNTFAGTFLTAAGVMELMGDPNEIPLTLAGIALFIGSLK